jgi:hypothetical protein
MKRKKFLQKFLQELLGHTGCLMELKRNGEYYQLVYDDGGPLFAEVATADDMRQLLFDIIFAHKEVHDEDEDAGLDAEGEAEGEVLADWHERGKLIRSEVFKKTADAA